MRQDRAPLQRFWDFSISVYAHKEVEAACLELQRHGLSVNVALWIVWTCLYGRDPRAALGQAIDQSALFGAQVIQPLRQARAGLKPPPGFIEDEDGQALRKSILSVELEAERLEQTSLERLSWVCPEHQSNNALAELALGCLNTYAERLGVTAPTTKFIEVIFSTAKIV